MPRLRPGEQRRGRLRPGHGRAPVIATVFLPLTFITGFFGQNFGRLTRHIQHGGAFVGIGLGTELLAVLVLYAFFKRRGWF